VNDHLQPSELKNTDEVNKPDEIRDLSVNLFNLIENQITRADTKAGLILAADTVFATAASLLSKGVILNLFDNAAPFNVRLTAILTVLTIAALFCSTVFALLVARPVMRAHDAGGTLFFFGRISLMGYEDFVSKFTEQSSEDFRKSLLTEVHTTARLARKKFIRIRYSLDFLIAAILLWGAIQIVAALSH
jgi:hypothetical protein